LRCPTQVATCRKISSRVSFLKRSVSVARGMSRAERNPSNVRVPKKASRMIRNAQASETISRVRATEQFRSPRAEFGSFAGCSATVGLDVSVVIILAVAARVITTASVLRDGAERPVCPSWYHLLAANCRTVVPVYITSTDFREKSKSRYACDDTSGKALCGQPQNFAQLRGHALGMSPIEPRFGCEPWDDRR